MAPRISPKKTWEGAAASLVASVGVGWLLFTTALPHQFRPAARWIDRAARRACSGWNSRRWGRSFC